MTSKKKTPETIKVVVRIRPLSTKEIQDARHVITIAHEDRGVIEVRNPSADGSEPAKNFTFDSVFSEKATQRNIYDVCAAPVVQSVLEGYNGTVFAYGQTGAGKTHTMEGVPNDPDLRGIIPNSFQHIFDHVALKDSNEKYLVRASYFEIYNEEIRDLLSKNHKSSLNLKESADSGVYIKGLTSTVVKSFVEIDHLMQRGKKNRSVGSTQMNQGSSRSHSVFTIVVECCSMDERGEEHIRVGKLNLVDLAGSERQAKTGATGERLKEATKINLSLSALGNVISALVDGKSHHVPYRDSKLTRILQDSLGGNTKTVMCANAGPAEYNYDETLSTLRYANRAKNIKNKPVVNEDPKDAMLREYQDEISKLKAELANMNLIAENASNGTKERDSTKKKVEESKPEFDEEKLRELKEQVDKEKAEIEERSKKELEKLKTEQSQRSIERQALEAKLEDESKSRAKMEEQRLVLQKKLQDMEAQMMIGGEIASKASKQEAALRKAEQDLIAKREKEIMLSRQMAEQEETNLQLEEKYSSLNDEVQSKTKKLKKIFTKYQQAKTEIKDLQVEFQSERNDMLETIRDLTKHLKLKELVISNFIPPKYAKMFDDENNGGRSVWKESEEMWIIPRLDIEGNKIRRRQHSIPGLPRPESEYARHRKKFDKSARWRFDNVINLDLIPPDQCTQEYEGGTLSSVSRILDMDIDDETEQVYIDDDNVPGNPYLRYTAEKTRSLESKRSKQKRPKTRQKNSETKSTGRPRTARY